MQIRLLGEFTVVVAGVATPDDGWRRRNAAALVKVLALTPRHELHREQILDALWPDLTVDDAAPRLHKAAHFAAPGDGRPDRRTRPARRDGRAAPGHGDLGRRPRVRGAGARPRGPTARPARRPMPSTLYGGLLLPADLYEPWAEPVRDRLRLLYLDLLRQAGRFDQLLAEDPADEEAHLAVMRTLVDAGDRRAALRQYERMDRALQRELGVGPSPDAVALRDELLASLPGAPADVAAASPELGRARPRRRAGRVRARPRPRRGGSRSHRPAVGSARRREVGPARRDARAGRAARVPHGARGRGRVRGGLALRAGPRGVRRPGAAAPDPPRRSRRLVPGRDRTRPRRVRISTGAATAAISGCSSPPASCCASPPPAPDSSFTIDDVQEADEASLRFLHYLARCSLGEQVVLVLASRDGVGATTAPAFERVRASLLSRNAADELVLAPFDRDATAELLARVAPSTSIEHVDEVFALSGGLAFSIVEIARQLARDPQATGLSGATALTGLDPSTRDALQRVAVLGATFATDEFIALSGLADDDAYRELDAALAARVVERTPSGYQFRHALLREALLDVPAHRHFELHRSRGRSPGRPRRLAGPDRSPPPPGRRSGGRGALRSPRRGDRGRARRLRRRARARRLGLVERRRSGSLPDARIAGQPAGRGGQHRRHRRVPGGAPRGTARSQPRRCASAWPGRR